MVGEIYLTPEARKTSVLVERLPAIRLTGNSFREWVVECEKENPSKSYPSGKISSCKTILDAAMPQTLQNGILIKSRKGDIYFDLIKLRDGKKLLYTV
jgi:hypothetical protein